MPIVIEAVWPHLSPHPGGRRHVSCVWHEGDTLHMLTAALLADGGLRYAPLLDVPLGIITALEQAANRP